MGIDDSKGRNQSTKIQTSDIDIGIAKRNHMLRPFPLLLITDLLLLCLERLPTLATEDIEHFASIDEMVILRDVRSRLDCVDARRNSLDIFAGERLIVVERSHVTYLSFRVFRR